jgi:hypothetical protein
MLLPLPKITSSVSSSASCAKCWAQVGELPAGQGHALAAGADDDAAVDAFAVDASSRRHIR